MLEKLTKYRLYIYTLLDARVAAHLVTTFLESQSRPS